MNLKVKRLSSSLFAYCYCLLFFLLLSFHFSKAQNATTDPSEEGAAGVGLWLMVGFGFAADLMDGFRFYGFVVMGLSTWVCGYGFAGMGLWWIGGDSVHVWWFAVWVCGYGGCGFAMDPQPWLGNSHSLP
ncbi:hypothetical protein FCV25MIE_17208 [Fagus crenata]